MRDYETYKDMKDIGVLYQYLWMDKDNSITFNNGIADLTIRMDDNQVIWCKNHNFPELDETSYMDMLYPSNLIGIIYYLENSPPKHQGTAFKSRWEEIKVEVGIPASLHNYNKRR